MACRELFERAGQLRGGAAQLVLLHAASVNKSNKSGRRALHYAAAAGHAGLVSVLLEKGADPEKRDDKGQTAAHLAAASGCLSTLRATAGAIYDIDKSDFEGCSSLHVAAAHCDVEMCSWLIEQGAEPNRANEEGDTPLHCVVALKGLDAPQSRKQLNVIKLLLSTGCVDINRRNSRGRSVLLSAASAAGATGDGSAVLDLILAQQPKLGKRMQDSDGNSAMHLLSIQGNSECVRQLHRFGGSIDAYNKEGHLPLHLAAAANNGDTVRKILVGYRIHNCVTGECSCVL